MSPQITNDDVGKSVINTDGDEVGMITVVEHGTAHVKPDPGITDSIKATLSWGDSGEDTYPLQEAAIGRVTDDEIHLERDISGANTTGGTGDMNTGTGTGTTDDRDIDRDDDDDNLLGDNNTR